jgi:hypothetical protein
MLNYGSLRNLYRKADSVTSSHLVVAEWNMNKYQQLKYYGIYKNPTTAAANTTFNSSDANIVTGENFFIYDDKTKKLDSTSDYFSSLTSIFFPNRPNPGIVLLQNYGSNIIVKQIESIKSENINSSSPRYYPFSFNREYDYFNTAKAMGENTNDRGVKAPNGNILCANPYVVYKDSGEDPFPVNKITIKVQNHLTVPDKFIVQYLNSSNVWTTAYNSGDNASALFNTGILDLYFNSSTWSTTVSRVTDLSQISSVSPTQLVKIKGLRLLVSKMSTNNPGSQGLEIIELSPRLEVDLTDYTESFSFDSSIGDSTSIGLPVGSIVSSTGNISLSNEDNQFLFSSVLNDLNMLNPDTKFTFYQIVNDGATNTTIPLKIMYSNEWNVGQDYSVSITLEDKFKFLRETAATDLLLVSSTGTKLSTIILTLLDNAGITGLEFVTSSLGADKTGEDVKIRTFFCKKEQTVAEVLEQLAIATQCSMFFDETDNLNILTKEKLTEKVTQSQSTNSTSGGTDMWMVFDEDYTNIAGTGNCLEYNFTASYNSNVISYNEIKLNPVTDGDVIYHTYGPRKVPGINNLPEKVLAPLTSDIPAATLAFSNYTYATKILWTVGNDNSSVLGCANLVVDLPDTQLKNQFTSTYTALNEEEAIRLIYRTTNLAGTTYFPNDAAKLTAKKSLVIFIDRNEGFTIPDYEGYILIDREYIKYRGKLFSINGQLKILFSDEELQQEMRFLPKGSSISIIGLIVNVVLEVINQSNGQYTYKVVGDGRSKFSSELARHVALAENNDGISPSKQFKLTLGEKKQYSTPGSVRATTKFNFIDKNTYRSAREALGSIGYDDLQSYLGFLKLSGPNSPQGDISLLNRLDQSGPTEDVIAALNQMNKQVDEAVTGNSFVPGISFDDYVFMQGERNIYGQWIDLPFIPNSISTRMRLFSSIKKIKNNQYIMSTNSSIAGIGFGLNSNNEGYFVEVESVGAGKDNISKKAARQNLRMYKVSLNEDGKYEPTLLFTAPVGAYAVSNTEVQVVKNTNTADPVFELEIRIEKYQNGMKYDVYYGSKYVNSFIEASGPAINVDSRRIFMFVRNDSQAIYEWVAAAARPVGRVSTSYFKSNTALDQAIQSGIIPVNQDFIFKDNTIQYYFNDFAKLVRQVKEYDIRYETPAYVVRLIDISSVNPEYLIKQFDYTSFGAKLVVANTSSGPILLGEESNLPLYLVGIGIEELSTGKISMKDYYDLIDEKKKRVTTRERNLSTYGAQTFNFDSQYIQTMAQAKNMMRWINQYCSRQRLKMSLEIFPNPILQLGDKIRIYDKSRGYIQENPNFNDKVFVVSSISHSVSSDGPSMNIEIVEVGQ